MGRVNLPAHRRLQPSGEDGSGGHLERLAETGANRVRLVPRCIDKSALDGDCGRFLASYRRMTFVRRSKNPAPSKGRDSATDPDIRSTARIRVIGVESGS